MDLRSRAGTALVVVAIGTALFLGTLGWVMVGFGTLTDCTNAYSCTQTGCPPCEPAARWLGAGAAVQAAVAAVGVTVLAVSLRRRNGTRLTAWGVALLSVSVLAIVGTTWGAQESYCRPGTPGYAQSYCSVGS